MGHWFNAEHARNRGNFDAANDQLLALFSAHQARETKRWRCMFGYETSHCEAPATAAIPINVRAMPKSSSGS
jgi:DNA-binding SARP family transcriptional activator